jgi:glycerophosphoryl diester phosphodiesterase
MRLPLCKSGSSRPMYETSADVDTSTLSPPVLYTGVTGHRGNPYENPENTIQSFKSGITLGCDWVEADVQLSKDGYLVVCHNEETGCVGDKDLAVAETTWKELSTVDVATNFRNSRNLSYEEVPFTRMPLLEEVLDIFSSEPHARLTIQPKRGCIDEAFDVVRDKGMLSKVGFNDVRLETAIRAKERNPAVRVFMDREGDHDFEKDFAIAREYGIESMVVENTGATAAKFERLREAGIESGVWAVDEPEEQAKFLKLGAQRIYTNAPRALISLKAASLE